jgi:hypothetical protein
MQTLHKRRAGLGGRKKEVVACLRLAARNKASHEARRFPATAWGLAGLAEWLEEAKRSHVAMEATGVYWKPVWHMLEGHFALILANAAPIKGVPGRKSDTNDATWIADLLAHGLIRASFVPPRPIQSGRRFPPQDQLAPGQSKKLKFQKVTGQEAMPLRPERHVPNSIATLRRRIAMALARALPRCPCCGARRQNPAYQPRL